VLFQPLLGIFNQEKYLPVRYAPITIELELVNSFEDIGIWPNNAADEGDNPNTDWFDDNCSKEWKVIQVQVKCDVCTLDNALDNEYAQHLLSGKSLPISYSTYVTQNQILGSKKSAVNVTRSVSRLKSVFVTLDPKLQPDGVTYTANTGFSDGNQKLFRNNWNTFYHPSSSSPLLRKSHDVEFQMQIGSKLYPEYSIRSLGEAFYQLRKCIGFHSTNYHAFSIKQEEYRSTKFISAIDTERVLNAGFTGINTKAGDLMTLKLSQFFPDNGTDLDREANRMHIILHADMILSIRDTGCEVLE
jgi:hypothetical protein